LEVINTLVDKIIYYNTCNVCVGVCVCVCVCVYIYICRYSSLANLGHGV
jgi:hypothetical protein